MKDIAELALDTCRDKGATYADIRIVTVKDEDISVKLGNISVLEIREQIGFGIRALADGGFGFAGSYDPSKKEIQRVAELAVRIAKASGATRKNPVELTEEKVATDSYSTPVKKDPFKVPIEEKVDELVEVDKRLKEHNPDLIKFTKADYRGHSEDKIFSSTDGAYITQKIVFCGGGFSCMAISPGSPPQRRSYPGSFRGDFSTSGYEFFESRKLLDNVERIVDDLCRYQFHDC
ncbi:MAG: PmbA/TldA family metallopeptidase [Candidatus Thorarchaeota archaeon]